VTIYTEQQYERILKDIEKLMIKPEKELTENEKEKLDVLFEAVEKYEKIHYPMN